MVLKISEKAFYLIYKIVNCIYLKYKHCYYFCRYSVDILHGFFLFLKLKKINKLQTQLQSKRYKSELRIKLNIVSLL